MVSILHHNGYAMHRSIVDIGFYVSMWSKGNHKLVPPGQIQKSLNVGAKVVMF